MTPAADEAGAKVGTDATYSEQLTNTGSEADSYVVSSSSSWTASVYDSTCTTALATTATVQPGAAVDLCVKVSAPLSVVDGDTNDSAIRATSVADSTVSATANLTTTAFQFDALLVDEDTNNPVDSRRYYEDALSANGIDYSYWDLTANPTLPLSVLAAHEYVIWFTGNTSSGPITPYEPALAAFLDGGGRLFMSGQNILDGSAGTTAFVHDYLHIEWDGSETQNDKPTNAVHGSSGQPRHRRHRGSPAGPQRARDGLQGAGITPTDPAAVAFTDDSGAADALSVASGGYKIIFLAFPFEAYGSATNKADLLRRAITYLGA